MFRLADEALAAAPAFPTPGRWTPLTYTHEQRGAVAGDLANAIRRATFMLTAEERARFAIELLDHHSCDHAHAEGYGDPT
jgi:hypothetical protein